MDRYNIGLLPGLISINGEAQEDWRDPAVAQAIYQANALSLKNECTTDTPAVRDVQHWLEELSEGYDTLLIQTISRTTSPFFETVNQATNSQKIKCRLLDTKTALTGQAASGFWVVVKESTARSVPSSTGLKSCLSRTN